MTDSKKAPEFTLRDGMVQVTCWANDSKEGRVFYRVDTKCNYKVGNDWKSTASLSGPDILRASNLMTEAYNRILAIELDS